MAKPYTVEKGGKTYMYRATSHYSAEKKGPVADTEYMGVVVDGRLRPKKGWTYDEETGEFKPIAPAKAEPAKNAKLNAYRYGDAYLLDALQRRLGILDDLEASFGYDEGRRIMAVAMAYTIHSSALMHMDSVIERRYIPELLGIPRGTDFSSPRMSELTRSIGRSDAEMDEFFRRRISGADGEFIFDLTSESTYSSRNSNAEWGRNKDNVPLRQINLGLVTDRVGRPLMFYIYPGSMADVKTITRMVSDIRRMGAEDATLVLDRGFVSPGSLHALLGDGMDFVVPMKIDEGKPVKALVTELLDLVGKVESTKVYDGRSYTVLQCQMGVARVEGGNTSDTLTRWDDPDGYSLVAESDPAFGSCDGYLNVFAYRDTAKAGQEAAAMDVGLQAIIDRLEGTRPKKPEKAFSKAAGIYEKLLEYEMDEGGMHVRIRQNAKTFAANRKGIFIMVTPASSNRGWDGMLGCYRCRDAVEDTFFQDKSEGDGRVPRSGDRETVVGRTFVRMVSMIMTMDMLARISEFSRDPKVNAKMKPRDIAKRSPGSLLDSLSNLEIIEGDGWRRLTELTKDDRLIFEMFDVGPPKGIDR